MWHGSSAPNAEPSSRYRFWRARRPIPLMVVLAALLASLALVVSFLTLPFFFNNCFHTCPSDFAPSGIRDAAPGSPGCSAVAGRVCYLAEVDSSIPNLPVSDLRFAVTDKGPYSTLPPNTAILGPGASVSVLNSTSGVIGVWNLSAGAWSQGPSGDLPTTTPVVVVLDTGLRSNATLAGDYFWVEHYNPYPGSVGFPLGY